MSAVSHVARMTLREKCAQMVFFEHRLGGDDPERTSQLVRKDGAGGMLLVGGSVFEVPSYVNWAQKVAKFPMLVVADYSGGAGAQVQGATAFPPAKTLEAAQTRGRLIGVEAIALGVRLILLGAGPHLKAEIEGAHFSKAAVCLQRFPEAEDPDADAVLLSNEIAAELDDETPVSQSRAAVQGALRRERRFEGLVLSDAASPLLAANVGADVILAPADPLATIDLLEGAVKQSQLAESTVDRAVTRILLRKERLGLFGDRITDVSRVEKLVGSEAHREAAKRMEA